MHRTRYRSRFIAGPLLAASLLLLGACASQPTIRTNIDQGTDLSVYRTFGFPAELGTDRGGYSTLITSHFKEAVTQEMTARGYQFAESNPDLLVNFFANVRERTEVRSDPTPAFGYYGYRYGLYSAWPLYRPYDIQTVTYRVGTVNVDIVDAARKQMVWEGIAEGTVSREQMDNPRAAIHDAVALIFQQYPGRAGM